LGGTEKNSYIHATKHIRQSMMTQSTALIAEGYHLPASTSS